MDSKSLLENIKKNDNLSKITKQNYTEKLNHLCQKTNTSLAAILKAPNKFYPLIKEWFGEKQTSLKAYLIAVLAVFKYNQEFTIKHAKQQLLWKSKFTEAEHMVNQRYESNKPSEKQTKGYVSWDEIIAKRDSLTPGSQEKLLLAMYTYIKPLRADFGTMAVYNITQQNTSKNYIDLQANKLVVTDFKTAKHYDAIIVDPIPTELVQELNISIKEKPRSWVFCSNTKCDKPFLNNRTFAKWARRTLQRLFNKPVTLQLIRHAYINSLDFNQMSIAEKKEIAANMGHDIATQDRYRLLFQK